jgi:hypothetical protein
VGAAALLGNTTGSSNTGVGTGALESAGSSNFSTAVGFRALQSATVNANDAFGYKALGSDTTGVVNTAIGHLALFNNTTGNLNVALGNLAGFNQTTGNGNVYIGQGVDGVAGESNHTYIRNINATSVSGGGIDTVTVNLTTGLLGHLSSSRRYKEDIKPMDKAGETLYQLKPVTYRYKKEIDSTQSAAFGLIAEEVAEVNPALVACNAEGQPESVHYEMINAMLLNEFLKEHERVEQQQGQITALKSRVAKHEAIVVQQQKEFQATIARQENEIRALTASLKEQAAQIRHVSAQIAVSKSATTLADANQ